MSNPTPIPDAAAPKPKRPWWQRLMRWVLRFSFRLVLTVLALFVLLWFLLKIPVVQNYAVDKVAGYLSSELGTEVTVGEVDIAFFNSLLLKDLQANDLKGDTLLYSQQLQADFEILSFLDTRITLEQAQLQNVKFYIQRKAGERDLNLQFLIDYFDPPSDPSPRSPDPGNFRINKIQLEQVHFRFYDEVDGMDLDIALGSALIEAQELDLLTRKAWAERLILDEADVQLRLFEGQELPVDSLALAEELRKDSIRATIPDSLQSRPWDMGILYFDLRNSRFRLVNELAQPLPDAPLDLNNLDVDSIRIQIDSFSVLENEAIYRGHIQQLQAKEKRGFVLEQLRSKTLISDTEIRLAGLELRTPQSHIRDSIVLSYPNYEAFNDFERLVRLHLELDSSVLQLNDLLAFAPSLAENAFFERNKMRRLSINGSFKGAIERLRSPSFQMRFDEDTELEGSFTSRDLTNSDALFMDAQLQNFRTTTAALKKILGPDYDKRLDSLGYVQVQGSFFGFLNDFVSDVSIKTGLGTLGGDLQLRQVDQSSRPSYSGQLYSQKLNLKALLGEDLVEEISFNSKIQGRGLSIDDIGANWQAGISSLKLNGYSYDSLFVSGRIDRRHFTGRIEALDPAARFQFDSIDVNLNDSIPRFFVRGLIDTLNLQEIKLSKEPIALHTRIDGAWSGNHLDNFTGSVQLLESRIQRWKTQFRLDSIDLTASNKRGERYLRLFSEVLELTVRGNYSIQRLPIALAEYARQKYPDLSKSLGLEQIGADVQNSLRENALVVNRPNPDSIGQQGVQVKLHIKDSTNITQLLSTDWQWADNLQLSVNFDSERDYFQVYGKFDSMELAGLTLREGLINENSERRASKEQLAQLNVNVANAFKVKLKTEDLGDSLDFSFAVEPLMLRPDSINLKGHLWLYRQDLQLHLDAQYFDLLSSRWTVAQNNAIRLNLQSGEVDVRDFKIASGRQILRIDTFNQQGLRLLLESIDLGLPYQRFGNEALKVKGSINGEIKLANLMKVQGLQSLIRVENLGINGDDWGRARLNLGAQSLNHPLEIKGRIFGPQGDYKITNGKFYPAYAADLESLKNAYSFDLQVDSGSYNIIEHFLAEDVSNMQGRFSTDKIRLRGHQDSLRSLSGNILIHRLQTTINFLQTRYSLSNARIELQRYKFIMPEQLVWDEELHLAHLSFEVLHENFGNIFVNKLLMSTKVKRENWENKNGFTQLPQDLKWDNRFWLMNTTGKDNSSFYGKVYAEAELQVQGPLNQLQVNIRGKTLQGTRLSIPLDEEEEIQEINFVTFVDKQAQAQQAEGSPDVAENLSGVDIEMNIELTPAAEVRLIFDEQAGDIIEGSGSGVLRIIYTATEEFYMTGNYEITEGQYLFTYQNFINKPFTVIPGGTIVWNGDPYDAQLNIKAKYDKLRVSLYNLLAGYLQNASAEARNVADQSTAVDLYMSMQGSLLAPDISFDIEIPDVDPSLRTYTESALRAIREDENQLNRQVFALIALQQFLPIESGGAGVNLVSTGVNTLSEMLSSQLSGYLSELISQVIGDKFVNQIEFDFGLNYQEDNAITSDDPNSGGTELNFGVNPTFYDNRLIVRMNGNVDLGGNFGNIQNSNPTYFGGDFVVEYLLTRDGRFRLRAYARSEVNILGRTNRAGGGISYRREFNTFKEFVGFAKEDTLKRELRQKMREEKRRQRGEKKNK